MNSRLKTVRRGLAVLLIAYWLAMFVATHVPRVPQQLSLMPGGDKSQHLIAYAGLAFLIGIRQSVGDSLGRKRAMFVFGIVALYGVIDELTQIPVGRTADVNDWLADVTGAGAGLGLLTALRATLSRRAESRRGSA
jgi:VanZ family protein